jgi:UrcA family protein
MKALIFVALALATVPPAFAAKATGLLYQGDRREVVSVQVPDGDLDMSSEPDRRKLTGRLLAAMREICGKPPINTAPRLLRHYTECKRSLAIDAQAQMDPDRNAAFSLALSRLD